MQKPSFCRALLVAKTAVLFYNIWVAFTGKIGLRIRRFFMNTKAHEIDMTQGALFGKLVAFAIPLLLTSVLQLLFNSADMIVVGQFVSYDAVGAVGATGSLNSLIVNLAIGFSSGTGVVLASAYGANDKAYGDKVLHSAMLLSVVSGLLIAVVGYFGARTFLTWMNTTAAQIDDATTYLEIIFIGAPFNMVYNFGSSMLRATGDTKRPLVFLTIAGVINVIVNIVSVTALNMGVAGVAIATIMSQAISAVLVVITLIKNKGFLQFSFTKLRFDRKALEDILKLGIPTGVQSSLFSISNVLLQNAINGFGNVVVDGSAVSGQIEGYVFAFNNSISTTALYAIGQNYGVKNYKRIRRIVNLSLATVTVTVLAVGWLAVLLHNPLCRLFIDSSEPAEVVEQIIAYAFERIIIICGTYFIDGIMEVVSSALRGIGYPIISAIMVLVGTCLFRILWIYAIFPTYPRLWFLFSLYPISWTITSVACWLVLRVKLRKDSANELQAPIPCQAA